MTGTSARERHVLYREDFSAWGRSEFSDFLCEANRDCMLGGESEFVIIELAPLVFCQCNMSPQNGFGAMIIDAETGGSFFELGCGGALHSPMASVNHKGTMLARLSFGNAQKRNCGHGTESTTVVDGDVKSKCLEEIIETDTIGNVAASALKKQVNCPYALRHHIRRSVDDHERHPPRHRHAASVAARHRVLRIQSVGARLRAGC